MRLYPPLPLFGRQVAEPVRFRGHALDPGALALVSPYVTGRDPAFWSSSERFDPARWRGPTERPEFAFYPFGGGATPVSGRPSPRRRRGSHSRRCVATTGSVPLSRAHGPSSPSRSSPTGRSRCGWTPVRRAPGRRTTR
ncbi:cytochrome P450 [Halosegnis marinus]|uniref:cytochrome P450 n=1 Tax=Halosegnis marinus TaxID=3034023 RepID=UPI00361667FD